MAISHRLGWHLASLNEQSDPCTTPNSVILPHRSPDSGSFVITLRKTVDAECYH